MSLNFKGKIAKPHKILFLSFLFASKYCYSYLLISAFIYTTSFLVCLSNLQMSSLKSQQIILSSSKWSADLYSSSVKSQANLLNSLYNRLISVSPYTGDVMKRCGSSLQWAVLKYIWGMFSWIPRLNNAVRILAHFICNLQDRKERLSTDSICFYTFFYAVSGLPGKGMRSHSHALVHASRTSNVRISNFQRTLTYWEFLIA